MCDFSPYFKRNRIFQLFSKYDERKVTPGEGQMNMSFDGMQYNSNQNSNQKFIRASKCKINKISNSLSARTYFDIISSLGRSGCFLEARYLLTASTFSIRSYIFMRPW